MTVEELIERLSELNPNATVERKDGIAVSEVEETEVDGHLIVVIR